MMTTQEFENFRKSYDVFLQESNRIREILYDMEESSISLYMLERYDISPDGKILIMTGSYQGCESFEENYPARWLCMSSEDVRKEVKKIREDRKAKSEERKTDTRKYLESLTKEQVIDWVSERFL